MIFALLIFILAAGWAAATGSFEFHNLLLGGLIGGLGLLLMRERINRPRALRRLGRILSLFGLFLRELMMSAIRVALLVMRPGMMSALSPGIVAFPLRLTRDAEITLLANLITLTPGTLSVDVSEDRRHLYVHALRVPDREMLIREIADGFEQKIIEAFE